MFKTGIVVDESLLFDVPYQKDVIEGLQHYVVVLVYHQGTELDVSVALAEVHIVDGKLTTNFLRRLVL